MAAAYNNISLGLFLINQVAILLFSRNGKKDRKERTSLLLEVRKEEGGKIGGEEEILVSLLEAILVGLKQQFA